MVQLVELALRVKFVYNDDLIPVSSHPVTCEEKHAQMKSFGVCPQSGSDFHRDLLHFFVRYAVFLRRFIHDQLIVLAEVCSIYETGGFDRYFLVLLYGREICIPWLVSTINYLLQGALVFLLGVYD